MSTEKEIGDSLNKRPIWFAIKNPEKGEIGKWICLLTLLTVLFVVWVLPTIRSIRANTRDLSTASSRLVGHWQSDGGDHELYFTFDPSIKVGRYVVHNRHKRPSAPMRFKVLFESGELVRMRKFHSSGQLMGDYEYRIGKNGQSMTLEYCVNKSPILTVFRYVDNNTAPCFLGL